MKILRNISLLALLALCPALTPLYAQEQTTDAPKARALTHKTDPEQTPKTQEPATTPPAPKNTAPVQQSQTPQHETTPSETAAPDPNIPLGRVPRPAMSDSPKTSPFGTRLNPAGSAPNAGANLSDAIVTAAEAGNLNRVKELLAAGANIDTTRRGMNDTALLAALKKNNIEVAAYLLNTGANPKLKDQVKGTTLQWAAHWGDTALVSRLISLGGDVNNINNESRSPIHYAVRRGHTEVVRILIEHGANIDRASGFGSAPIDLALQRPRPELTQLLVDSGAKLVGTQEESIARVTSAAEKDWMFFVDAILKQAEKNPPLLQRLQDAAFEAALGPNHERIIVALAARGSGVSARTIAGFSRFFQACAVGSDALVQELLDNGASVNELMQPSQWTPLHAAAASGRLNVVALLLKNGAGPNTQDGLGRTPLHLAVDQNRPHIVSALLRQQADSAITDFVGETPLHYAAVRGGRATAQALVEAGASLTVRSADGITPLEAALRNGHDDLAALLTPPDHTEPPPPPGFDALVRATAVYQTPSGIEMQRDALLPAVRNGTPLIHLAIMHASPAAVNELITPAAADRDAYGYLPLHIAAATPGLADIAPLLEQSKNINDAENLAQWTPLHCAAAAGNDAAARALLDKGATRAPQDALGQTPADVARMAGHPATAALLQ